MNKQHSLHFSGTVVLLAAAPAAKQTAASIVRILVPHQPGAALGFASDLIAEVQRCFVN